MTVTYPASTVAIKHKNRQHKLDSFIPPAAIGLFFFFQKSSKNYNTPAFCVDCGSSSCSRSSHASVFAGTGSTTREPVRAAKHNAHYIGCICNYIPYTKYCEYTSSSALI